MRRPKHQHIYDATNTCLVCQCEMPKPGTRATEFNPWPGWDKWTDPAGDVHYLSVDDWCAIHSGDIPVYCWQPQEATA